MIPVADAVQQIVNRSPFIEEGLSQDVINLSRLARTIRAEVEEMTMKKVSEGAIVMALKRMAPQVKPSYTLKNILNSSPDLIVRSNLFEITFANSQALQEKHEKLLQFAKENNSSFVTITHGVFETTVIVNKEVKDIVKKFYKNERIIASIDNLSSITIKFSREIISTPGVYYMILKCLAWEGINITEVVSTYSECTIILKQTDVDYAFSKIKKLFAGRSRE